MREKTTLSHLTDLGKIWRAYSPAGDFLACSPLPAKTARDSGAAPRPTAVRDNRSRIHQPGDRLVGAKDIVPEPVEQGCDRFRPVAARRLGTDHGHGSVA